MLTQTLRGRDGLVHRQAHAVVQPRVEYELKEMGKSVIPLLRNLCEWARANAKNRKDAGRRFAESGNNSCGPRKNTRESKSVGFLTAAPQNGRVIPAYRQPSIVQRQRSARVAKRRHKAWCRPASA
jgi:hypothetical protein